MTRNAHKRFIVDDYVVYKINAEHLTHFRKLLGDGNVSFAWSKHSRRMVVNQNYGCGGIFQSRLKNFSRMYYVCIYRSDRNHFIMYDFVMSVQIYASQMLFRQLAHVFCIFKNFFRGSDYG